MIFLLIDFLLPSLDFYVLFFGVFFIWVSDIKTVNCNSHFNYEFLSGAKVLFSVMNYGSFLLRKHHFLLQLGVAR